MVTPPVGNEGVCNLLAVTSPIVSSAPYGFSAKVGTSACASWRGSGDCPVGVGIVSAGGVE